MPRWTENAVLVYGPRKSGTTLMLNLLDGSEELFAFPTETKFKRFLTHWKTGCDAVSQYFQYSLVLSGSFPNFDSDGYNSAVENLRQKSFSSLKEILRHDALAIYNNVQKSQAQEPKMFAMKEVGGDPRLVVGLFRQHFIDGKVVMIARQPRYVTRSVFKDRRRKGLKLSFMGMLREVIDPIRVVHHQAEIAQGDSSVCPVLYEELVANPKKQIERIVAYLGISQNEIFERPTIFGQSVVVKTSSRQVDKVFVDNAKWYEGLTVVECVSILFGEVLVRLWGLISGKRYKKYCDLQCLVEVAIQSAT